MCLLHLTRAKKCLVVGKDARSHEAGDEVPRDVLIQPPVRIPSAQLRPRARAHRRDRRVVASILRKVPSKIAKFHLQIVENRLDFSQKSHRAVGVGPRLLDQRLRAARRLGRGGWPSLSPPPPAARRRLRRHAALQLTLLAATVDRLAGVGPLGRLAGAPPRVHGSQLRPPGPARAIVLP